MIYIIYNHILRFQNKEKHIPVCVYIYIYIYIYIQSWSELLATMVNVINEGCENESALLIRLIFYKKKKLNLKWGGKYNYEIHVFLQYTLATINGTIFFNTF